MEVERSLISKAIYEGDLSPIMAAKILPEFFADDDHRAVFEWVLGYYQNYNECPTARALKREFPDYRLVKTGEPYQYYLDELREKRKHGIAVDAVKEAIDLLDERSSDEAFMRMSAAIVQVNSEVSNLRDTDLNTTWEQRLERYDMLKNLPDGMRGIPTGFPSIDRALSGLQTQQLITLIGLPKTGKSTLMMRMAISAQQHASTPLFISFEMSNEEQEARYDAMIGGVSYQKLLTGRLTADQRKRLARRMRQQEALPPFILSSDISSATTVSGLAAKIEQYKPKIVFIDGVYLMDDELGEKKGTPQALTNITRGLKRMGQRLELPAVGSTQVLPWKMNKRLGLTADAIGYTSSFAQDSDVILGVEKIEDETDLQRVRIVAARSAPTLDIRIKWQWETSTFVEQAEGKSSRTESEYDYDEDES